MIEQITEVLPTVISWIISIRDFTETTKDIIWTAMKEFWFVGAALAFYALATIITKSSRR